MRRTRLVAAAFAGSVFLAALVPVPAVASEPVAEVSPRRVHPGGTVTVTVTCGKHDEQVAYITAYSRAFAEGEAKLKLLPRGGSGQYGKPTYQGKARIASAHTLAGSGSYGSSGSYDTSGSSGAGESAAEEPATEDSYGAGDDVFGADESYGDEAWGSEGAATSEEADGSGKAYSDDPWGSEDASRPSDDYGTDDPYGAGAGSDARRHGKSWSINGSCPDGSDFTTKVTVERKPSGGPHAGLGGGQGEMNTAAVAAGGALLSATVGFGVHMLRRRRSGV